MKNTVSFFWRITYSHTIAYFIAGVLALWVMNYENYFSLEINAYLRPIDAPIIVLGPLLQIFRGLIIAAILLPLRQTFFEEKHGLLKLGLMMIGFSLLSTFGAMPGSFEGLIYTIIPVQLQIIGYPEAIVYFSLFIFLLHISNQYGHKKIINIPAIILIAMIGFMSIMGFLMRSGKITSLCDPSTHPVEVYVLSEGEREGNADILIGITPEMLQDALPEGNFSSATNVFLVRTAGKNILIDAGYGRNLFNNLQSHGLTPEQIDAVLITHAHGDHIGGLLCDGKASFPNADLYIAQKEYDFWSSDEAMNHAPENRRAGFLNAQNIFKVYQDRLHIFIPDELCADGIMLFPNLHGIAAYGHTPGHTVFEIEEVEQKLLIWGDLTHAFPVQMRYPELAVTYDVDKEQAVASRLLILDYVAKNNIRITGMHIASSEIGTLSKNPNGGFQFFSSK